ncbi:hypothetical protein [uncultured Ruminococcus sp.]|uniref:hypothetical protein n=1 Tax=uncultured Ruminococcus sp. TaxID=165186 RepID=UPI0025EBBE6A|nr:hypothetical protein [uncultured Ruminococcus sp.]
MNMKRFFSAAVMVPVMLLCSCGANSSSHKRKALAAVKNTYGVTLKEAEDHEGSGVFGRSSGYCDFYATCSKYPGMKIRIVSEDGKNFGSDLLVAKYREQTEWYITDICSEIYGGDPIRVIFDEPMNRRLTDKDMNCDEFLQSGMLDKIIICTDDTKDPMGDYGQLVSIMRSKNINCFPVVYHFADGCYVGEDVKIHTIDVSKRYGMVQSDGIDMILDSGYSGTYKYTQGFG